MPLMLAQLRGHSDLRIGAVRAVVSSMRPPEEVVSKVVIMRILAVDFGEKRVGLAISDPDTVIAIPLTTLQRTSDAQIVEQIVEILRREQIELIIIGEPLHLDGKRGAAADRAASFARKLERASGLECRLVDETLTSVAAEEKLREAGLDPRRHRERIDAVAAQILLQQFLDSETGPGDA